MTANREYVKPFAITCKQCGHINVFKQPYAYHAGFADQGFLYNDEGNLTLVWSAYDSDYVKIVGQANPWVITEEKQKAFENWLPPAPKGGNWGFKNPGRCLKCKAEITPPIGLNIYYVLYPDSIVVDGHNSGSLKDLART
ncbi:MAG TPA: hypothetical protein VN836_05985 [Verrucomicrobiae bacterium]|nr:hypothetical protein [Verrucomicrobiae bacterium]